MMLPDASAMFAEPPMVAVGEVHLWIAPVSHRITTETALRMLAPDERSRAQRFAIDAPRDRFIAARVLLRQLLAAYLHTEPGELRFQYGDYGKPALCGSSLRFNLSHADEIVLIAVATDNDVGVDVERIRAVPHVQRLMARYFTHHECSALDGTDRDLLQLWTCKEAALKASGLGISAGWDKLEILGWQSGNVHASGLSTSCHIELIEPATGYVAAVAASGAPFRLRIAAVPDKTTCTTVTEGALT